MFHGVTWPKSVCRAQIMSNYVGHKGNDVNMEAVPNEFHLLNAHSRTNTITKGIEVLAGCSVGSEH